MKHLAATLGVAIVVGGGLAAVDVAAPITGAHLAPAAVRVPVPARTLICPGLVGVAGGRWTTTRISALAAPLTAGAGRVTVAKAKASAAHQQPLLRTADHPAARSVTGGLGPYLVEATGALAAGLEAEQLTVVEDGAARGWSGVRCTAPGGSPWFLGASGGLGKTDDLLLVNPDPTTALVAVDLWGPHGPIAAPAGQGIAVPGRSRRVVPLASLAPDLDPLAVHVIPRAGRIAAALFDERVSASGQPAGADFLTPLTAPGRVQVLPGLIGSATHPTLLLADPGPVPATATVQVVGTGGSFVPSGLQAVTVPAGRTAALDLGRYLDASVTSHAAALRVTADAPVLAAGLLTAGTPGLPDTELAWTGASPALAGPTPVSDLEFGSVTSSVLVLSAPAGAATARLVAPGHPARTISVPAGRTVTVPAADLAPAHGSSSAAVLTPEAGGPLYAARMVDETGAHGPLLSLLPLASPPQTVTEQPANPDPAAGT
jgi:hypothetical protein